MYTYANIKGKRLCARVGERVCASVCEGMCVSVSACVRERVRAWACVRANVCARERVRERERVCVLVCACGDTSQHDLFHLELLHR